MRGELREDGACKARRYRPKITGWGFDAACERGKLHFYIEMGA